MAGPRKKSKSATTKREPEPEVLVAEPVDPEELEGLEGEGDDPDVDVEPDGGELEDIDVSDDLPLATADEEDEEALPETPGEPRLVPTTGLAPGGRSIARTDPLQAYMQEIRRYPLLSREEEHELAVRYAETGDVDAARRLITSNLRLVVKIAYEYRRAYRNLLDLIQEGNVGLMQAVRKYDPYRGVKLSSYAAWWIRAYILKFILANWRLVKIGTTQAQRKLFFNLRKEQEKLEQMGFEPSHKLLAERLDVSEKEVAEMSRRLNAPDMSLDQPVGRDDDSNRTRLDFVTTGGATRPDVKVEAEEFHSLLREKLRAFGETLEGRDKDIFEERLLSENPLTLQDLGDRFGISRERARQIEKRLLTRLRKYLEEELGSAVDIGAMD